ncbi:hypothetical protein [Magnetococcus sp. PR-3]|uniref:hypothetical protein n=1 Tax=Magnetococcus sp. PR-3 TaxID=3120355 RepID=UPI002FCE5102
MTRFTLKKTLLALLVLPILLSGCVGYKLVKQGEVKESDGFKLTAAGHDWSMIKLAGKRQWTFDGASLQRIQTLPAISSGKDLSNEKTDDTGMAFDSAMSELEIMELFVRSFKPAYHQLKTLNLFPAKLDGHDGFEFDFTFKNAKGLDYQGVARGAVVQEKLYLIFYVGTQVHYFKAHEQQAREMINTAKIKL